MSRRRRSHRWLALIALFGLLFQQVAMATYLCPIEQSGRSHQVAAATDAPPCHAPAVTDAADPVRCQQHCHPTVPSADHTPSLTVPAAMLAPPWAMPSLQRLARLERPHDPVDPHAGAPPLSVRYCSFQI